MQVKIQQIGDAARVDFEGNTIDTQYGPIPEIVELIQSGIKKLLINLGAVEFLNSAGISSLIAVTKLARDNNVNLGIYNLQSQPKESIERTGMIKLLPIFDCEIDAASFVGIISQTPGSVKNEKILVIEKELEISHLIFKLINDSKNFANCKVISKDSLESSHILLQGTEEINLIVLDITFDAVEIQKFLKKLGKNDKTRAIPVLAVTDEEKISVAYFLVKYGITDVLRYPINTHELEMRVSFALNYFQKTQKIEMLI